MKKLTVEREKLKGFDFKTGKSKVTKKEIAKATHPKPNWNGYIPWQKLHSVEIITCCDCGLAHQFEFKNGEGALKWRAKRSKEATKLARKKYKTIIIN